MCASVRRCSAVESSSSGNVPSSGSSGPRSGKGRSAVSSRGVRLPPRTRLTGRSKCDHEQEDDVAMAGAMRKMAVYLGLVEDDRYERYETYTDEYAYDDDVQRTGEERSVAVQDREEETDAGVPAPRP